MIKKILFGLYGISTYLLWMMVIVAACVVLGLRYYALPHAKDYREAIAQKLSQAAGQRIAIGDIDAGWDGMQPHLDLYRVTLFDAQNRPALQLDHVETGLSWLSVILAEPHLAKLVIHNPQLIVRRAPDGEVFVAGISVTAPGQATFPNWLLRQSEISVQDATVIWQDEQLNAPALSFKQVQIAMESPMWESLLGHHRFGLRATPSAASSQPIDIRGNLWGKDVDKLEAWRGTLYGKLEGTDIAAWRTWVKLPFNLLEGQGASQFWLDFSKGQADKITADVVLGNVHTRFAAADPETRLKALTGRLSWRRLSEGHEIQASKLKLETDEGFDVENGSFRVASKGAPGKEALEGEADLGALNLESFTRFATHLPLGDSIQSRLTTFEPKGSLEQLHFSWKGTAKEILQYGLRGRFTDLGIRSGQETPGFSHLSGSLDASESQGSLQINSNNTVLDAKGILRWPVILEAMTGDIRWQTKAGVTEVKVNDLALANAHIKGHLRANYRFGGNQPHLMDMTGHLDTINGKFAKLYYPMVMSSDTLEWLDHSILDAQCENINFMLKGNPKDFPFAGGKTGEFKVTAHLKDGIVNYSNRWPTITNVQMDMLFRNERMELTATHGESLGAQITRAKIVIPDLDAEHTLLQIQGEIQAPVANALGFIAQSPISQAINHFTDGMTATGSGKVALDIQLPTSNADAAKVKGSYLINNGSLRGEAGFPPLDRINGKLQFTESALNAQNLNANIYGGPGIFNLETGNHGQFRVTGTGRVGEAGIRQIFNHPLMQKVHGSAEWNAEVLVHDHQTQISVRSPLTGLVASLPPPFNKSATEAVAFKYATQHRDADADVMDINYGNIASFKLLKKRNDAAHAIERGEIRFGGQPAELPNARGVVINGKLARLDWDSWSDLLLGPTASSEGGMEVVGVNLDVDQMDAFGRRLNGFVLAAKSQSDGWSLGIKSKEVTGNAQWTKDAQGKAKVVARLSSLVMPDPSPAKMSDDAESPESKEYPALDIVSENFEWSGKKLGRLELLANQQGGDWHIDRLNVANPESVLRLSGDWHSWRRRPNTSVNVNWEVSDLGKTLDRLNYQGTIKGGNANLSGQLRWPGSPHEFSLAALGGNLKLEAKNGQFLKIQPGVGRLLGVLSLQALPRRLLFDFKDVFSEGFAFDLIGGTLQIERGVMKSQDFKMEGPAAKVVMSGETSLENETLSMHVKVNPSVSDTLSLAALAGGPVAGAAAFVAQKLFKDPLNKIAGYEYDIGGTWSDPQEIKPPVEKKVSPVPNVGPLGK